jgi:hypothetical protein
MGALRGAVEEAREAVLPHPVGFYVGLDASLDVVVVKTAAA